MGPRGPPGPPGKPGDDVSIPEPSNVGLPHLKGPGEGVCWGGEVEVPLGWPSRDSDSVYCLHSHLQLSLQVPWGWLWTR